MKERITKILEHWFIQEPALFQVLCTHKIVENRDMPCAVRSGRRRVEYNPDFLREMSDSAIEEALRTEGCRILLGHNYSRKPDGCSGQAIAIGSNLAIGDNYVYSDFNIEKPADYDLQSGMPYEWYSRQIQRMLPPGGGDGDDEGNGMGNGDGQGGGSGNDERSKFSEKLGHNADRNRAISELWEEDDLTLELIHGIIESTQNWGSLAGAFAEKLKASTKAKLNWHNVFAGFRSSVLSSRQRLTRMHPNRRYGFEQMGRTTEFDTKLLIAVDVSGSITSENLSYFYGVVNSAFRYGFAEIDVIQFDHGVRVLQKLKKVIKDTLAVGRGGTSFEEPINYAHEHGYDGLVILTDGYAPEPRIPEHMRCKILWVCQDQACYDRNSHFMKKSGRVCTMELR